MIDFLLQQGNLPFSIALACLFGFAALEVVSYFAGAGLLGLLDDFLPHFDAKDAPGHAGWMEALSWTGFGHVPLIVFLLMALLVFGSTGLMLQFASGSVFGGLMHPTLASIAALVVTVPIVGRASRRLGRVIPRDPPEAVSETSFIGRPAEVVLGTARPEQPAQARLRDAHGQSHYVLVEPLAGTRELRQGEQVILVEREGARFYAIPFEEHLSESLPEYAPARGTPGRLRQP